MLHAHGAKQQDFQIGICQDTRHLLILYRLKSR